MIDASQAFAQASRANIDRPKGLGEGIWDRVKRRIRLLGAEQAITPREDRQLGDARGLLLPCLVLAAAIVGVSDQNFAQVVDGDPGIGGESDNDGQREQH